jgi:capsule polysaccharide export protein KpsE/RkpR
MLVIEPPIANDPRAATAVTPVYLESLKTYEQFAASDSLFQKACVQFHLSDHPCSDSFKNRVLRVTKLKDTKLLRISVTLPDSLLAQKMVQFLATETVALNRTLARDGDRETLADVQKQQGEASEALRKARSEYEAATATGAARLLEEEVRSLSDLKARAGVEILRSRAALAEGQTPEELARLKSLETESVALDRKLTAQSAALAAANARQDRAGDALRNAASTYDAWAKRANETAIATGLRTEQLRVVDPGVVPQQPSFPNIPLFTGAALLISALLTLVYLSLRFGLEQQHARRGPQPAELPDYRTARGGHR